MKAPGNAAPGQRIDEGLTLEKSVSLPPYGKKLTPFNLCDTNL